MKISLSSEKDKIEYLNYLYSKGVKQSYLTNGGSATYTANFDYHYKVKVPGIETVDATGSGDGFVAGLAYARHKDLSFKEGLAIASSIGALNAGRLEVCNINPKEIEEFKPSISISPIGKKMKTLDVTPG
jgi:fructose-1-phosphate kinase PfkB-like protein